MLIPQGFIAEYHLRSNKGCDGQPTDKPLVMSGFFVSVGWDGTGSITLCCSATQIWFASEARAVVSLLA